MVDLPEYAFAKLELAPGDILAIKSAHHMTAGQVELLKRMLEPALPVGVKFIVMTPGFDIVKISRKKIAEGRAKDD